MVTLQFIHKKYHDDVTLLNKNVHLSNEKIIQKLQTFRPRGICHQACSIWHWISGVCPLQTTSSFRSHTQSNPQNTSDFKDTLYTECSHGWLYKFEFGINRKTSKLVQFIHKIMIHNTNIDQLSKWEIIQNLKTNSCKQNPYHPHPSRDLPPWKYANILPSNRHSSTKKSKWISSPSHFSLFFTV